VLTAAEGRLYKEIVAKLGSGMKNVCQWRRQLVEQVIAGIEKDAPRGGHRPTARVTIAAEILRKTTSEKPSDATHWSTRALAAELGTSKSMVQRVGRPTTCSRAGSRPSGKLPPVRSILTEPAGRSSFK
jgi:hypothetical protein